MLWSGLGGLDVDRTGSVSCTVAGFGISIAESSGAATTVLVLEFIIHMFCLQVHKNVGET
jgi:hypothetical protein